MKRIFLILLISTLFLISGCLDSGNDEKQTSYSEEVNFYLDKNEITVYNNLPHLVTVTIKQLEYSEPVTYTIKLVSPNMDLIYFEDVNTNKSVESLHTKEFTHAGETQLYDFRIFGKKCEGQDEADYSIKLRLIRDDYTEIGDGLLLKVHVI
jgi:hypothetical protein